MPNGAMARSSAPPRTAARIREDSGGDPACWLDRVCDDCGRFVEDQFAGACPYCGAARGDQGGKVAKAEEYGHDEQLPR